MSGPAPQSLAGTLRLQGEPLCDEDLRGGLQTRAALGGGGQGTQILRHGSALLIGTTVHGSGGGRFAMALASEFDNAGALRAELASRGAQGAMMDDAALLRKTVRTWGQGAAARLEGDFASGVYDTEAPLLLCGRDRFGIAPFHYGLQRDGLAFDLTALAHWPALQRAADHEPLTHYLAFGLHPVGRAPLQSVQRLRPAHTLWAELLRGLRCERDWTLPAQLLAGDTLLAEAATELRTRLERAVEQAGQDSHSLGVIPTGDAASDALTEAVRRGAAHGGGPKIRPFQVGSPPAVPAGQAHAVPLDAACAIAALELVPRRGAPFADPEALALHGLLAAAGGGGPLYLSAAGGVELLLDHPRYTAFSTALARQRDTQIPTSVRQGFNGTRLFLRDLVCVSSEVQRPAMSGTGLISALLRSPVDDFGASLEGAEESHVADLRAHRSHPRHSPDVGAPRYRPPPGRPRFTRAAARRQPFGMVRGSGPGPASGQCPRTGAGGRPAAHHPRPADRRAHLPSPRPMAPHEPARTPAGPSGERCLPQPRPVPDVLDRPDGARSPRRHPPQRPPDLDASVPGDVVPYLRGPGSRMDDRPTLLAWDAEVAA